MQHTDRVSPLMDHVLMMSESFEISAAPMMPQMFGNAGVEHMKKYGIIIIPLPVQYEVFINA